MKPQIQSRFASDLSGTVAYSSSAWRPFIGLRLKVNDVEDFAFSAMPRVVEFRVELMFWMVSVNFALTPLEDLNALALSAP